MDEHPVEPTKETRTPIAATGNRPQRIDYEYERCGTACVFMFTEPLAGWRQASIQERRTKRDWAIETEALLTVRYKDADKIVLVRDTSTRTPKALV
jgi:hypothetical protein